MDGFFKGLVEKVKIKTTEQRYAPDGQGRGV
jgi:hypothetical protein